MVAVVILATVAIRVVAIVATLADAIDYFNITYLSQKKDLLIWSFFY